MHQLVGALCLVVMAVLARQSEAIECYSCDGYVDQVFVSHDLDHCIAPSGSTPLGGVNTFTYCTTEYTTSDTGYWMVKRRGYTGAVGGETNRCEGNTCYCTSDKCNNQVISPPGKFECYVCDSAGYFDNGCGEEVDEKSEFVRKVSGCSACGKQVSIGANFVTKYSRGCARAFEVEEDECFGEETSSGGKTCICQKSLCNSAHQLTAFSLLSTLLLLVAKVYC